MTTQQEVFFSMALKVKNFAAKNPTLFSGVPGASVQITTLNTLINQLITADGGGNTDLTGFAISKAGKRQNLETLALKISNVLSALAINLNDPVLQKKADYPTSFWYKATEDELITQASVVKSLATPQAAALVPYGVSATDLTNFTNSLDSFIVSVSDPTLAIDKRKIDKEKVEQLIDDIRTLLNSKLDVLMRILEATNPNDYNAYLLARAQDQRSGVATPTVISTIAPNTTISIHTLAKYEDNTFYTIQNVGKEAVVFSLSDTKDTEGNEVVLLASGETRSRQAQNLSATGTHFTVKNASVIPVEVKLWVE